MVYLENPVASSLGLAEGRWQVKVSVQQAPGIFGTVMPQPGEGRFVQPHASGSPGFCLQVAGDETGVVGAQGAADARPQHPGQGMGIHVGGEGPVRTGADVDGNAAVGQQFKDGVLGPDAMDDARDAAIQNGLADIRSGAVLARMGRDAQAREPGPVEDRRPVPEAAALQSPGGEAPYEGGQVGQHQVEDRVTVFRPEVIHRIHDHAGAKSEDPRERDAILHSPPEVTESELPAMDHEEVRRGPKVEAAAAAGLGAPCHGQDRLAHRLAAVQEAGAEEEGLDEAVEGEGFPGPEGFQAGRQGKAAPPSFAKDPRRIQPAFEVGVTVDQRWRRWGNHLDIMPTVTESLARLLIRSREWSGPT